MFGKRIDFIGCTLILIALLAPNDVRAQPIEPTGVGKRCHSIGVHTLDATQPKTRRPQTIPSFSASKVLDLELTVRLPRSIRAETVELNLFTPEGHLYQTLSVPVSPATDAGAGESRGPGSYRTVSATLPVAGTTIVRSSLYGTWKVEAYLDRAQTPCGPALELAIRP